MSWSQNPLTPKIQLLYETNISLKHKRKDTFYTKLSLLESYCDTIQFLNKNTRTKKLSYFNLTWSELLTPTQIEIDIDTGTEIKNSQQPNNKFNSLAKSKYSEYVLIYTDGSIDLTRSTSGASFVVPITNVNFGVNLGGIASIESCEMYAIHAALSYTVSTELDNVLIISDSRSSLKKLKEIFYLKNVHPLLIKITKQIFTLITRGTIIKFLWIPSHVGIEGNERADRWARRSSTLPYGRSISFPISDLIPMIVQDFQGWKKLLWPHYGGQHSHNKYFYNTTNKTKRPFLAAKLPDFDPDCFDLDALIYNPDKETVIEIGKFFDKGNFQI